MVHIKLIQDDLGNHLDLGILGLILDLAICNSKSMGIHLDKEGSRMEHLLSSSHIEIFRHCRPNLHPRGGFFGPWSLIILKNSQDLSNEGSNFVLSSLEVGHWVAQT